MDLSRQEQATGAISDALLARLKRDTQASHLALESRINLIDRVRTAAGYAKLLEAFYGLFSPIEERLGHHQSEIVAWIPDIQNRMRTALLRRDLRVLGNASPEDLPVAAVPAYDSLADQIGCLYVLEGSTLGGQVISRQIGQALGYTPEHGCEFFYGHGTATGDMWQRFRKGIESYASARPSEEADVIQSAVRTFQAFDIWMAVCLSV
jgi:heme oxygenase